MNTKSGTARQYIFSLLILCCSVWGRAQDQTHKTASKSTEQNASVKSLSAAERIAGLRKLLDMDRERRTALNAEVDRLEQAFREASDQFTELDAQLKASKEDSGQKGEADTNGKVAPIEDRWRPARDRFERIIERRKAVQQQLKILDEKIALEQEALGRLESADADVAKNAVSDAAINTAKENAAANAHDSDKKVTDRKAGDPDAMVLKSADSKDAPKQSETVDPVKGPHNGLLKTAPLPAAVDNREIEAERELNNRQAERDRLAEQVQMLERSIDVFERDLAVGEKLLTNAEAEAAAAKSAHDYLASVLARLSEDDPSREELERQLHRDGERLAEARKDVEKQRQFSRESQTVLERMKLGHVNAKDKVAAADAAIASARTRVWYLKSPFAPHRAVQWIATNGPRVLVVVFFVFLARWLSRLLGRKVVSAIVRRRGASGAERDARAETLGRVFQNATGTAILVLGVLAIFDQLGVNVTVLLGGAAVIGAGVAFGSQNLIRDFFAGFMILVENQYSVGSVVKIGDVAGVVEDISLRTTVLRDEEGVVHFVPHGQINTVSNMTYSWSRAVITIPVSYKEDVDQVMHELLEVARQLRNDPAFSIAIIDEPEMLGVEALGDSSVLIKFLIKTRPLQQWNVKREVLRRIKKRFDELHIEIPPPQRAVHLINSHSEVGYDDRR